jgi:sialidase-1
MEFQSHDFFETPVFNQGEAGIHTYRIPALVCSQKGTLLAMAEGRTTRHDVSQNVIALKRSLDGGRTWLPVQIILDAHPDSYNNPTLVCLHTSTRILLFVQRYPFPCVEFTVEPGLTGPKAVQNIMCWSDDDGVTWSEPVNITAQTKRPTWATSNAFGPGIAIQLQKGLYKGRIIVPVNQGPKFKWDVYAIYSDDEGKTWQMGEVAPRKHKRFYGNEVQMVELPDGAVMLNSRSFGFVGLTHPSCRLVAISKDGCQTWSELTRDKRLIEPHCQGSILRYSFPEGEKPGILLFSNPAHKVKRIRGTIKISYDDGKTWSQEKTIQPRKFAYSCLTVLSDGKIGIIYETGNKDAYEKIQFACFPLTWLET